MFDSATKRTPLNAAACIDWTKKYKFVVVYVYIYDLNLFAIVEKCSREWQLCVIAVVETVVVHQKLFLFNSKPASNIAKLKISHLK